MNAPTARQQDRLDRRNEKLYQAMAFVVSNGYKAIEPTLYKRTMKNAVSGYDFEAYAFKGGELEQLTSRNYEKSLRKLWKAEKEAPFLGFKDASELEKAEAQHQEETEETAEMISKATADDVVREFREAYTPEQQKALGRILSLIGHGEAFALFTSSRILSFVEGTGARMGMAMQVMEEAKHFIVLRKLLKTLGVDANIDPCVQILYERIAAAPPYRQMFGMNVLLESIATSLFSQFSEAPGVRHIMHPFHMDEARHVGFVRSYDQTGLMPKWVRTSKKEQAARMGLILPALPVIYRYREDFRTLGLDSFTFFGTTLNKIASLAEDTGFIMPRPKEEFLELLNVMFNNHVRYEEPENWNGYVDYTKVRSSENISEELLAVERKLFGEHIFDMAS